MRVPHREYRGLRGIERELRRSEPHLAGMLAIFTRLSAGEAILSRERVRRSGNWVRLVPALLAAAVSGLAVAAGRVFGHAARRCAAAGGRVSHAARAAFGSPSAARHRALPRGSLKS